MAELVLDSFAQTNSGVQQVVIEAKSPTWGRQTMIPNSESQIRNHNSADVDVIEHVVNKCTLPASVQVTPCTKQVTPCGIPVSLADTVLKSDFESNVEPVLGTIACEIGVDSVLRANTNIKPEIEVSHVLSGDSGNSVIVSDAQTVVSVSQSTCVLNTRDSDSSKKRIAIHGCDQPQAKRVTDPCFVNCKPPHEGHGTCIPDEIVGNKTSNDTVLYVGQALFVLPVHESFDPNAQPRVDEQITTTVHKCVQTASCTLVVKDSLPAMNQRCWAREKGKKNGLHLCSKCNLGFTQKAQLRKHVAIQHRIGRPKRSIALSQNGTLSCRVTIRRTKKFVTKSRGIRQSWRNKVSNDPRGETNVSGNGGFRKARVFFQCKECGDEFCCRQDFNVHTCRFDKHVNNLEKENGRYSLKPKEQNGVAANASLNSSVINEEKPYKCIQCGAAFRQNNHLLLHVRTHSRSKVSHVHGLRRQGQVNGDFHTSVNEGRCDELKRDQVSPSVAPGFHNPIYLGKSDLEKRFPGRPKGVKNSLHTCRECNSAFTRKQLLDKHAFERHGFKRYNCKKCYASFTQESALHHHIQNSYKKCLFRQSKARQKQKSQRTLNRNHKEKKDSFQLAESLTSAIKEGEFLYACQECREKFSDKQAFTTHSCINQMHINDLGSELKRNGAQPKIPDSAATCQKNNPLTHCPLDTKEVHMCEEGGSSSVCKQILEQQSRTTVCQQLKATVNDASVTNSSNCSNNITSKTHASSNANVQLTSETSNVLTDESVEPALAVVMQNVVPLIDSPIQSSHVVPKNESNVSNEFVDETSSTGNMTHQTEAAVGAHEFTTPDLSSDSVQLIPSKDCEPVSECSVEQDDVITSTTPIDIYICDECGAKFTHRIALLGHCRSHKRNRRRVSVEIVGDHTSMLSSACNVASEEPLHEPVNDLVIPNTTFSTQKKLSEFNCSAKDPHQVTVNNDVTLQNDAYKDPLQNNGHEDTLPHNAHKVSLQNDVSGKLVDKVDEITDAHDLVVQPPCNRNHDSISPNAETEFDNSNLSNNTVESIVACSLAPALASISDCGGQRRRPGRPKGSKNGMYTCRECNSVFRKKFRLKNHLVRDGVGGYTCSGNVPRTALNCHTSKEDQKEKSELEKSHLTDSTCCHVPPNQVFGKLCYADFVQEVSSYKCQDCNTNFSYKCELALHVCLQRGPVGDPSLQQNGAIPSDTFIKRGQLSSSIKSKFAHKEKPYKCNQCGATFVFKKNLQRHCLMYKCSNLGTTFVDSKLNANLTQTNSRAGALLEQRLYKCGVCQLRFTTYPRLTAHLRSKRHRLFRPHVNRHEMRLQHNLISCSTKFSHQSDLSSPSLTQSQSPSLVVNTISEKARGETAVNSDPIDLDFKTGKEKDDDHARQDVVAEDWWNAPCHFSEAQTTGNVSSEKRLHSFGFQTSEDMKCTADLAHYNDDDCSETLPETHSVSVLRQSDISIPKVNNTSGDLIDSDVAEDPVASPLNELVNPHTEPGFKWFDLFSDAVFEPSQCDSAPTEYSVSAFEESSDWPRKIIHLHTCEHCEHSLWNHTRSHQKDDAKGEIVTETTKSSDIVTDLFCDVPASPTRKLFSSAEHGNISPILQGDSGEPIKTDNLVAKCVSVDKKKLKTGHTRKYKKLKCKFCDAKFTIKIALYNHTRIHKKNGVLHQPGYAAHPSTISNTYETVVNDQQSTATCHLASMNRGSCIINGKLPSKMVEPAAHKCWTSSSELKLVTRRRGRPRKHPNSYIHCSVKGSLKSHSHVCQRNDVQSNIGTRSIPINVRLDGPTCERDVQSTKPNCVTSIGIPAACDDGLTSNSTSVCVPNLKSKRDLVDLYACNLCGAKFAGKLSLQSHVGIHKLNGHSSKFEAAHSPSDVHEGVKDQPCELITQHNQLDDLTELIQPVTTDSEPTFNETSVTEHSLRKHSAGDWKNCSSTSSYCGDECMLGASVVNRPCIPKPVEAVGISFTNTHEIVADDQPTNPTNKLVVLNATPGSSGSIMSDEVSVVNCASVSKGNLKLQRPKKNNKRERPYSCNHCSKQFTVKIAAWNHCRTLKAREVSDSGAVVEETCSTSADTFSYSPSTQLVQNTER